MIKLKGLKKRLLRLEASMQKDAKKLAKLTRKVETALRAEAAQATVESTAEVEKALQPARPAMPPTRKKKRELTPAGRAKLSALMKARWAAKRAHGASNGTTVGKPSPAQA